ncbi:MAG: class I SAM-dependent RNA methyltransferase [Candidatus Eisenbacteria bacterium]|nr:class I SAM-dependent RNA methyltransferase [Candidatus Eisenbacteria bacterium]
MFTYQQDDAYFAQAGEGTEELVAAEIERLGGETARTVFRGVAFRADRAALYRIVYASRLATRVLAPLIGFDCHSPNYLYKTALSLDWASLLGPDDTFAVRAGVANSRIRHSGFAALRVKDAVADAMRGRFGRRPNVDRENPSLLVHVHIHADHATIHADASGGSLHRRGYRLEGGEAPMRETTAAAVLEMAGWNGDRPLLDPMCGSGTILAEAWMRGCRIPAGKLRTRFGFERLPDFDRAVWERVRSEEDRRFRPLPAGFVAGSDADPLAVRAARANLARLPGGDRVRIERRRFQEISRVEGGAIVSNPPYGIRSVPDQDMNRFWRDVGDFLKQRCAGSDATLYFGERQWIRSIGLRPSWKRPLTSGGLDGRVVRYEMYEGAKPRSGKE